MNKNLKKGKIQKGGMSAIGKLISAPVQGAVRMGKGLALKPVFNIAGDLNESTKSVREVLNEGKEEILSPLENIVKEQIGEETEEEYAARSFNEGLDEGAGTLGKAYIKPKRLLGESAFWDLLYDEPCWLDPDTGTFDLATALGKLWNTWYIVKSPLDKIKSDVLNVRGNTVLNTEKLKEYFVKQYQIQDADPMSKYTFDKEFGEAVDAWAGDPESEQSTTGGEVEGGKVIPPDEGDKGDNNKLLAKLGIPVDAIEMNEIFVNEPNLIESFASGDWMEMGGSAEANKGTTGADISPKTAGSKSMDKWIFCFVFKFLMGPVGYVVLKLMPYFFKFFYTVYDAFSRIRYMITAGGPYVPSMISNRNGRKFFYKGKDGSRRSTIIKTHDTIGAYLGLVLPLGLLKYDWGQIYGNGHFGKFILTLTVLSAGFILLGGISVVVFLFVFMFYCGKTISMFGDNIEEQKKK